MLILNKLTIKGFRSFKDETTIEFPESGAILIKGTYKDREVNSGTGKSSIMLAISFALGYCSVSQSDLKNWDSKEMLVSLFLKETTSGTIYKICRSPKLSFFINDEEQKGSADDLSAKIYEIMKTPPELAKILTHREQRKLGFFVNATDAKKKEFLVVVLNLQQLEAGADALLADLNRLSSEKISLESAINTTNQILLNSTSVSEQVEQAKLSYQKAKQDFDNVGNPQESLQAISSEISQLRQELQKIQQLKMQSNSATSRNHSLREKILSIKSEIDQLKQNICPTCKRPWESSGELAATKEESIKGLAEEMRKNIAVIKSCETVSTSEQEFQDKIQALSAQAGQLKSPIDSARSVLSAAESSLRYVTEQWKRIESLQVDIDAKTNKLNSLHDDFANTAESIKILGREGFLGEIFDEILGDINQKTNAIVSAIPNTDRLSIYLTSTKENKNGTVKKSISTNIYKDGTSIGLSSLSGGQCAVIECAADLSTSEAIRRRSGSLLGWLCMDEALNELGPSEKAQALNVIKNSVSGQLLIIDHATEIKEGFEKVIEIEYDGRYSRVI